MSRRSVLLILFALILVIAAVSATVMVTATSYMNRAADYGRAHTDALAIPDPLPGSTPAAEPPTKVEAVARYGDTVEVQVTRRYQTARSSNALFTVTYFYAPTGDVWQLIDPPDSFWGDIKTTAGTHVAVIHPQRDQKLIDNLITVVDSAIETACTRWECPPSANAAPLTVHFVTDPANVSSEQLTYLVPRLTGVPMSRSANDDYLSRIAADTLIRLAAQLNLSPADARAEIQRQNLYLAP